MVDNLGPLKRAAIDAFMASPTNITGTPGGWIVQSDAYCLPIGLGMNYYVSRPDAQGVGGGCFADNSSMVWGLDPNGISPQDCQSYTSQYQAAFESVRNQIDQIFAPFDELPNPAFFDAPIEEVQDWMEALSMVENRGADATKTGSPGGISGVDGYLNTLDDCANHLAGGAITSFKTFFLHNLEAILLQYHDLVVVLLAGLGGEKNLWSKANEQIEKMISDATGAFSSAAMGHPFSWDFVVNLVNTMADGLAAVLSGPAAPLGVMTVGLKLVASVKDEKDQNPEAFQLSDFGASMSTVATAAQSINDKVCEQEQLLKDCLVQDNQAALDPSWNLNNRLSGVDDSDDLDPHETGLVYDPTWAAELCHTMRQLADHITDVRARIDRQTSSMPWIRDESLGLGYNGCFFNWDALRWTLRDLLQDLADELNDAVRRLSNAFEDLEGTNDQLRRFFDSMNR